MEISDRHVEWAVINRLKRMLDEPPKTGFNVTQSFAMFTPIVLWTKQRAWVGGDFDLSQPPARFREADHAALAVRKMLQSESIFDPPWSLSRVIPPPKHGEPDPVGGAGNLINADFKDMNAAQFIKWLRDALAHGDGRKIKPLYNHERGSNKTLLAGFRIAAFADEHSRQRLTLSLYHDDMKRVGSILADAFCRELSGDDNYFEREAGTATITEAA